MPMGFEHAARRPLDAIESRPEDGAQMAEEAPAEIAQRVRDINAVIATVPALAQSGLSARADRPLSPGDGDPAHAG